MSGMYEGPPIATIAALVGEPARASMLASLMDGSGQTASELAYVSRVSPQTASSHLGKLREGGLLAVRQRGRYRLFQLASPQVAQMLEGLMVLTNAGLSPRRDSWHARLLLAVLSPEGSPAVARRRWPTLPSHGWRVLGGSRGTNAKCGPPLLARHHASKQVPGRNQVS